MSLKLDESHGLPLSGSVKVRVTIPYAVRLVLSSDDDVAVGSIQAESGTVFEYNVILEKSQCSHLELDIVGDYSRAAAIVVGDAPTTTGEVVDRSAISMIILGEIAPIYFQVLDTEGSFRFAGVITDENTPHSKCNCCPYLTT